VVARGEEAAALKHRLFHGGVGAAYLKAYPDANLARRERSAAVGRDRECGPSPQGVCRARYWFEQAGWPQSHAISVSLEPASLQNWLQYFSPAGATQAQGT